MTVETITQTGALAVPGTPTGTSMNNADVHLWLERFEMFHKIAQGLAESDFIPKSMKPNMPPSATRQSHPAEFAKIDANATAAMMYGSGLGFDPLTSLQNMHVINGKPGMAAMIKHAIAQAHGHPMWESIRSPEVVEWRGRRKEWPADREDVVIKITRQEAIDAGWAEKKDTYDKVPADMLAARCKARVADRVIPELLHGVATLEDIRDLPPEAPVGGTTTVTASDIRARAAAAAEPAQAAIAAPVDPPAKVAKPAPEPPADAAPVAETGEAITLVQRKNLGGLLRQLDLGTEADALAALTVLSSIVGRVVDETKDLSRAEADQVLALLADLAKRPKPKWQAEIRQLVADAPTAPADGQLPMPEGGHRG